MLLVMPMALVSIPEYAKLKGKDRTVIYRQAQTGGFKSAVTISGRLYIDEGEPVPDRRGKSGKYIKQKDGGDDE